MAYVAQHDVLTGLPNRMLLNDRLAQAIAIAERRHRKLAVLFVDLDKFQDIKRLPLDTRLETPCFSQSQNVCGRVCAARTV